MVQSGLMGSVYSGNTQNPGLDHSEPLSGHKVLRSFFLLKFLLKLVVLNKTTRHTMSDKNVIK